MTGKTISLLVLSGIHAGARAELAENETKIGHSESCDLIFSDQNIEDIHCRIVLRDGEILIYRQDGDVMLYGKSIDVAEVIVGTVFAIGDVQIAIIDDDTDVDSLSAEKVPLLVNDNTIDDPSMVPYKPTLNAIDLDDFDEDNGEEEAAPGKLLKKIGGRSALIGASIAFIIILGLVGWELLLITGSPDDTLEKDPQVFRSYIIGDHPDFVVEQIKPGSFTIQGTVATQAEKQAFIRDVREKFGFSYIWRIVVIDDIVTDLKEQLGFYGANLSVSYVGDHINIRGYLADSTLLNELKTEVKQTTDIPTIWNIYGSKELEAQFVKNLNALKISDSDIVRYQWSENRLTLVSYKSANQEKVQRELEAVADKVEADLNVPLWVDYQFIDHPTQTTVATTVTGSSPPPPASASLDKKDITQVSTGVIPYVVLANGERLFIGAETGSGFKITAINNKGITLSNGRTSRTVTLD